MFVNTRLFVKTYTTQLLIINEDVIVKSVPIYLYLTNFENNNNNIKFDKVTDYAS